MKEFFVLAHNIRSLHNVGSIFRTAESFGVTKLYLTGYTGTPPEPKIDKVALGAEKTLPWEHGKSPIRTIKKLKTTHPNLLIVGLENNLPKEYKNKIIKLNKFKVKFPLLLIIGQERKGISKTLFPYIHKFLEIPMHGEKESLNVSVAFGVAAYSLINSY